MNTSYKINQNMHGNIAPLGEVFHQMFDNNVPLLRGKLTQATTAAPTLAVTNDCNYDSDNVTLTLARTSAGVYTITASSAIFGASADKVWSPVYSVVDTSNGATYVTITWTSSTVLTITVTNASGTAKDLKYTKMPFEVYVYPA